MRPLSSASLLVIHVSGAVLAITTLLHVLEQRMLLSLLLDRLIPVLSLFVFVFKFLLPVTLAVIVILALVISGSALWNRTWRTSQRESVVRGPTSLRFWLWCLLTEVVVAFFLWLLLVGVNQSLLKLSYWLVLVLIALVVALSVTLVGTTVTKWVRKQQESNFALRLRGALYVIVACLIYAAFFLSTPESLSGPFRVRHPISAEIWATLFYAAYALWSVSLLATMRIVPARVRRGLDVVCMNVVLVLLLGEIALQVAASLFAIPLLVTESSPDRIRREAERQAPGELRFGFPINQGGHYDQEFEHRNELRGPLVVSIGDSFSYGIVPHAYHFTTVAERELPGTEVYNYGYPGIGPTDYLHLLHQDALPLDPDLVVVQIFVGNDVAVDPVGTVSFRWHDADRYLIAVVPHRLRILLRAKRAVQSPASDPTRPTGKRLEDDYPWLEDPLLEIPSLGEDVFLSLETRSALTIGSDNEFMYARFFATLEDLERAAGSIPLAFVLIPDEFQVEDHLWEQILSSTGKQLDRDLAQRKISKWLQAQGIPVLDLLPILRAVEPFEDGRRHLYHSRDSHFNARGNALAGRALASFIASLLD